MKILSSFTPPQVVAKLYEFLSYDEHKGRYFEGHSCLPPLTSIVENKNTMEVKGAKVPIIPLCSSEERNSYRFATT